MGEGKERQHEAPGVRPAHVNVRESGAAKTPSIPGEETHRKGQARSNEFSQTPSHPPSLCISDPSPVPGGMGISGPIAKIEKPGSRKGH